MYNYAVTSGYDADGRMTWAEALSWSESLVHGGFDDWRLPDTVQPDLACSHQGTQNGVSFSAAGNCTASELGRLYYVALGNSYLSMTNSGPFVNIGQHTKYWSRTEFAPDPTHAWEFLFSQGDLGATDKGTDAILTFVHRAWAVRDGDVAAVPEPEAYAMLLAGLGLLGFNARRRKQYTT